jgi:hypothetical protein
VDVLLVSTSFTSPVPLLLEGLIPATGLRVQLNVAPAVDELAVYTAALPLQIALMLLPLLRTGKGLTVIVKLSDEPVHPL